MRALLKSRVSFAMQPPARVPRSTLWSVRELGAPPNTPALDPTGKSKPTPPALLGLLLTPLVPQLRAGIAGGRGRGAHAPGAHQQQPRRQQRGRDSGEREALAGLLPLLCQVAPALFEEMEGETLRDRCGVPHSPACRLLHGVAKQERVAQRAAAGN